MTCEKRSHTGLMVGSAVAAGCLLAAGAYAKSTPTKAPAPPKAVPVVHAGIPWWVYGLSALALVAVAVAATLAFVVVRLRRRERVVPPQVRAPQRELTRGPQRELTTSAQAWVRQPEKTEVKR